MGVTMKLIDYKDLEDLVKDISFLTNNENESFINSIYWGLIYQYGQRSCYHLLNVVTTEVLADIINNKYSKLWDTIKKTHENDTPLTHYSDTERTDNTIYGYNSPEGVSDYTIIKTYTKDYDNIYENYNNALAFFCNNNYYSIIVSCIVNEITLKIYESED